MSRPTWITVDLAALRHNFNQIKTLAPQAAIMAMVKANAYGHGLERVAQTLSSADAFGVASMDEGIRLRQAGVKQPIVLVEGLFYPDEIAEAIQHDFTLVVHHLQHLEMIENGACDKPFSVWLKINTGMHRLGFLPSETRNIYARLMQAKNVKKPIGLMTHFAEADGLDGSATEEQIALFMQATAELHGPRSLANSAGILAWPKAHADWIRPGIMLYGASPFQNKAGHEHGLLPVMTLRSQLIAIQRVQKGGRVGYGGEWIAPEEMIVGVVAIGYGDGYPQHALSGTPVLVNGQICPLVGRVSMDMLTVDLSNQPQAKIGDPVTLWGKGLPVERVALVCGGTSAYELLTRMTPRPKIEVV